MSELYHFMVIKWNWQRICNSV